MSARSLLLAAAASLCADAAHAAPRPPAAGSALERCVRDLPLDFPSGSAWAADLSTAAARTLVIPYREYLACRSLSGLPAAQVPEALQRAGVAAPAAESLLAFHRACASGDDKATLAAAKRMIKGGIDYYLDDDADWDELGRAWCDAAKREDAQACVIAVERFGSPRFTGRDALVRMCREQSGLTLEACAEVPEARRPACVERASLSRAVRTRDAASCPEPLRWRCAAALDATGQVCAKQFALPIALPLCHSRQTR